MNLNSNDLELSKIYNNFMDNYYQTIVEDLNNRYKHNMTTLLEIIEHLDNNIIKDDDMHIQIVVNYFHNYMTTLTEDEIEVINNNNEILTLKIVKLTLSILHKVKNHELYDITKEARELEIIKHKELITTKELELLFNIEERNQKKLRRDNEIPYIQKKDEYGFPQKGAKVTYNLNDIRKWINDQKH